MSKWRLAEMTLADVRETSWQVAVLPIGACEPHGFHLPYGTDIYEAEGIADRICGEATARGGQVVLLPTLPYGVDANQMSFPLAMDVRQDTLNCLIRDLYQTLRQHGIPKMVIFNSHGGNDFKPLLRELTNVDGPFLSLVNWWQALADVTEDHLVNASGDHANELEAAVMLELQPDLVHLDRASDGATRKTRFEEIENGWVSISRPWEKYTVDSTAGDPRQATKESGQALIEIIVDRIAGYIAKLSAADIDGAFPY
jgi:creatinine amidohydrolase